MEGPERPRVEVVVAEQAHQPLHRAAARRSTAGRTAGPARPAGGRAGSRSCRWPVAGAAGRYAGGRRRAPSTRSSGSAKGAGRPARRAARSPPGLAARVAAPGRRGWRKARSGSAPAAAHQPRQVDGAVAQAEVVAAFAEIEEGFVEVHPQADPRMRLEAGAGLLEERRGERRRRGEAQFAAQLRLRQFDLLPAVRSVSRD